MTETRHLKIKLLNVDKFVKNNNVQPVTNPIFFVKDNIPSPDGLLSNDIFGTTKDERSNTYAYVELHDVFIHPLCYKMWSRMDKRVREIVHGTKKFIIDEHGEFVEDESGKSGVKFLRDNFDKIHIRSTGSEKREGKIKFLQLHGKDMFIDKYIVIPPFYRDVNTSKGAGKVSVGVINKLYQSLIIAVRSLKETQDYGLSMSDATKGNIQESLVQIYDYFCGNNNPSLDSDGLGLSSKMGIVKRNNMAKTIDYSSRLVLSAPELKVEGVDNLMVNMDRSAVPLASACATFYPFMLFNIRRYFQNNFGGVVETAVVDDKGKVTYKKIKDPQIQFSDERIKEELKRFEHGFSNRFVPVEVEIEGESKKRYLYFKGSQKSAKDVKGAVGQESLINRRLTWCDVFYMAACESVKNKHVMITRFPMDSAYNQFPTGVVVSSTKDTEPVYYNGEFYEFYPKIREEDIGSNTMNRFIDTLMICNLFLKIIGGDYDGDQVSVKGIYTVEANDELHDFINSKANYIDLGGINMRVSTNEAVQAIYNLTKILADDIDKLKPVKF